MDLILFLETKILMMKNWTKNMKLVLMNKKWWMNGKIQLIIELKKSAKV